MLFLSHPIKYMLVIPLIIIDVNLDYLSEVVFVRSLLHKVTLFSSSHTVVWKICTM